MKVVARNTRNKNKNKFKKLNKIKNKSKYLIENMLRLLVQALDVILRSSFNTHIITQLESTREWRSQSDNLAI